MWSLMNALQIPVLLWMSAEDFIQASAAELIVRSISRRRRGFVYIQSCIFAPRSCSLSTSPKHSQHKQVLCSRQSTMEMLYLTFERFLSGSGEPSRLLCYPNKQTRREGAWAFLSMRFCRFAQKYTLLT